jgi:hypothetical protein
VVASLTKAALWKLNAQAQPTEKYTVQFNPDSLKVAFANQVQPSNQNATDTSQGTAATQHVGQGTTKLSVTLWFDVNAELPQDQPGSPGRNDVRKLTEKVVNLIRSEPASGANQQPKPPVVRFLWGTFQFDGLIESIEQTLEFFSSEGVPLRASLALSMTQQSIDYGYGPNQARNTPPRGANGLPSGAAPGTIPLATASAGSTMQGLAAAAGQASRWQAIAEGNGIENPRRLAPGQLIDMNVTLPAL